MCSSFRRVFRCSATILRRTPVAGIRARVRFRVAASSAGSAGEVSAIAAGSGAGLIGGLARGRRFCSNFKVGTVAGVVVCGGEVKAVGTGGEIAWDFDCSRR